MAGRGDPTWIGAPGHPVAAWVQRPAGEARGVVVLAPSLGREAVTSWRALHILGLRLAERGFASVRFDWRGTGDSAPLGKDVSPVEVWSEDLQQAQDLALQLSGGLPVSTIGLRLGASWSITTVRPCQGRRSCGSPSGVRHIFGSTRNYAH